MTKTCEICGRPFRAKSKQRLCSGGCRLEKQRRSVSLIPEDERPASQLVLRFSVFARDGFRCVYCGRSPLLDGATLELEHVVPRKHGGTNELTNLVAACRECNIGKKDRLGIAEILMALKKRQDSI